ncbi:MAG: type II restriction enzyme [Roseiflexaceae bacterium]
MRTKLSINQSWQVLFERHRIPEHVTQHGLFRIHAHEINTVHEARLMAKFDERQQLPEIFRQHHLAILPINRGEYVIGAFETFQSLNYQRIEYPPRPLQIPQLDSLTADTIHSEPQVLSILYNAGVWHDISGQEDIYPTISGRRTSGMFSFTIKSTNNRDDFVIDVANAQIEMDATYETRDAIYVCEAKNRHVSELNIRQLYYPYRFLQQHTHKPVIPISVIYSNATFYVSQYQFQQNGHFNSLALVRHYVYTLDHRKITYTTIHQLLVEATHQRTPIPDVPFPQADNFALICRIIERLRQSDMTTAEVTDFTGYVARQSDYFTNAGRFLGFIEKIKTADAVRYTLTAAGRQLLTLPPYLQRIMLIRAIIQHEPFTTLVSDMVQHAEVPNHERICMVLYQYHAYGKRAIASSTVGRRAQTVAAWLQWIYGQIAH